jgi:hypothetical protein
MLFWEVRSGGSVVDIARRNNSYDRCERPRRAAFEADMPVIELCESFSHFHYMNSLAAAETSCGKRGRVARILPDDTWMGAPGPFPATYCSRCSAKQDQSRQAQIDYFRRRALAIVAGLPNMVPRRHHLEEFFDGRGQAGVGYLDVKAEMERSRQLRNADGWCCTDFAPAERDYQRGSLIYT